MKQITKTIGIVLLVAGMMLAIYACSNVSAQPSGARIQLEQWEYKAIVLRAGHPNRKGIIYCSFSGQNVNIEDTLNSLGKEGWNLVSVTGFGHTGPGGNINNFQYTFKRRLP
jgi:hypothetical protein